jgi:hypothetical protein
MKLSNTTGNLRNKLNGACAGSYDGDVLIIEIDAVVPVTGMEFWPDKTLDSLEIWILRDVQTSDARDDDPGTDAQVFASRGVPNIFGFIPGSFLKPRVKADLRSEPVTLHATF